MFRQSTLLLSQTRVGKRERKRPRFQAPPVTWKEHRLVVWTSKTRPIPPFVHLHFHFVFTPPPLAHDAFTPRGGPAPPPRSTGAALLLREQREAVFHGGATERHDRRRWVGGLSSIRVLALLHCSHEDIAARAIGSVGRATDSFVGHYKALLWKEEAKEWATDENMGIHVSVEVGDHWIGTSILLVVSLSSPIRPPAPEGPALVYHRTPQMPSFVPHPSRHSRPAPRPRPHR